MSWIVASLLNNREQLKETGNIDSDEFNDLMMIEKAIEELKKKQLLSDEEIEVIDSYRNEDYRNKTRNERWTVSKRYTKICEKISFYLGGYFTDDGYLSYIQDKYKLNEEQINALRLHIKSKFKHKLIRKPLNHE